MKRTNTRLYVWLKTQRKYRSLQKRLLDRPNEDSSRFLRKLELLRKRLFELNRKWQIGVSVAALVGWMTMASAQAQNSLPANLNTFTLDGTNGFKVIGEAQQDYFGYAVSNAGDINGDGIDDMIFGAPRADPNELDRAGKVYIVFGNKDGFNASLAASDLNGTNGFRIDGLEGYNPSTNTTGFLGGTISAAGDINDDGIDDLMVSASRSDDKRGKVYVLFGKSTGFSPIFDLTTIDIPVAEVRMASTAEESNAIGFMVKGTHGSDYLGLSIDAAGDINGDGIDDIIIGAKGAEKTRTNEGKSFVIFGSKSEFPTTLDLTTLDGTNGFVTIGANQSDEAGLVAGIGDINADGVDDILIGAGSADPNEKSAAGQAYVVFGKKDGFTAELALADLDGTNGFAMNGTTAQHSISDLSGAGDLNGDGINDLMISTHFANDYAGETYVVFGKEESFGATMELSSLDGSNGIIIKGTNSYDYAGHSISEVGDVNGDGFDDIIVASYYTGKNHVIFGKDEAFTSPLNLSNINSTNGSVISVAQGNGNAVESAGDFNGDGAPDIMIGSRLESPSSTGAGYVVFGIKNNEPTIANALPDLTLDEGFATKTIDLVNTFSDADGDALTLSATSNDEAVATVAISGTNLTITEVANGMATIIVTADDGRQTNVTDRFELEVSKNNAPTVANALPDITLDEGFATKTIDLANTFSDVDGDALALSATSNNEAVATVALSGTTLTITEITNGTATIIVTADDGRQANVTDGFELAVSKNNAPTVVNALDDLSLEEGFATKTIDLANTFADADGDALTLSVASSDESIIKTELSGNELTITEVSNGSATITVTADDGRTNGKVTDDFEISIATPLGIQNSDFKGLNLYPNPITMGHVNIQIGEMIDGLIEVRDINGKRITQQQVLRSNHAMVDLSNENAGLYFISIQGTNQKSAQLRILKK